MSTVTQTDSSYYPVTTFLASGMLASSVALGTSNGAVVTREEFRITAGSGVLSGVGFGHVDFRPLAFLDDTPDGLAASSDAENVRWLHKNSGLTWDQLGRLFGVSRRTVHLWANGSRMNAHNAEALAQAVSMVAGIAAQTPDDCRAALLAQVSGRTSPFEAFAAKRRTLRDPMNAPAFQAVESLDLVAGDGTAEA
ncbi:MAG: helix-turn-helix domain-containing protein [Bifidobacteriaceae bacterium]|jgi:hypothetical protein|nr:helix-turn-helix domain-containing protein [Bifidobacteriaceae bacterium]